MKVSEAQIPAPDVLYGTHSKLQIQCIHTPVWPQPNETITIAARAVDGQSLAPKVARSLEIIINKSTTAEPILSGKSVNSSSTLNYTSGPLTNLTTISYGCLAIDNSTGQLVSSGMKKIAIGTFNKSRAVPVLFAGNQSSNIMDVLFVADNKTFSGPRDPNFLADVEKAIVLYYNQSVLLNNQNKTNFWIAQDMGQANNHCDSIPPANWNLAYLSFDAAVILHRDDSIRDCTRMDKELSTGNMATVAREGNIMLHEIGHRPFGLADEYDSGGFYDPSYPWQNVFNNNQNCVSDALSMEKTSCRKIPYVYDKNEYFTSDAQPNDLMVDNRQFQDLDNRRIEKWFENCLSPSDNVPAPPDHCGQR
jgi:hypothetical protein